MPSYYRIMAGAKSVFAQEFLEGGFIAANWNIDQDLTHDLPDDWREFNHRFVGQIQRYMGYVKDELAEADQQVKGVIIALEDDLRIRRALSVAQNIEFYRYQLSFRLIKGGNINN